MAGNVVLFATGSPVLVEVEESLLRASVKIAAGVRNRNGFDYLSDPALLVGAASVGVALTALPFLIPLFTPANRQAAAGEAAALGFCCPFRLIDPTTIVPRALSIGAGGYVNAGCVLGAKSRFGAFVFINRGASIGHHATIGDFVSIGPGVVIAGQVTIGSGCMIGAGAIVLPGISIGGNATIGAGSIVTHDIPSECVATGNPARVSSV
jgi:sugar O-acyltransferase (sialic acid O-acetyltransferase NeuD family)